jgi:hypothetical protein
MDPHGALCAHLQRISIMAIFEFDGPMDDDTNELSKILRKMMETINSLDERLKKLESDED